MGTPPPWLVPAFTRSAIAAGATVEQSAVERAADRLLERWTSPERHFHSVRHLIDLLQHVDELQQETHRPHLVRLAAWYHGAVFDAAENAAYARRGGEDEVASAEFARSELAALGLSEESVETVATLVVALARHANPGDAADAAVLSDCDLAILASDPQRYRQYLADVRAEYAHIPQRDYLQARKAILERLAARDRLYTTPLGSGWEKQARENIAAELVRLEKELNATV